MARKSKSKSKATSPVKDLNEADVAAEMIAVEPSFKEKDSSNDKKAKKNKSKRSRDTDEDKEEKATPAPEPTPTPLPAVAVKVSRKQKRQKLNEKNKWPQHPKIGNSEQRAKAYLRVAGIEAMEDEDATEFVLKAKATKLDKNAGPADDNGEEWQRFGRFLGGTDARTRHRAVKKLGQYLKAKTGFGLTEEADLDAVSGLSELDWMKLWKGLWYTLYMADKAPVQDELAKHLAKLIWCVAGTLEEDDFAGQAYLAMDAEQEKEQEEADDEEDDDDDVKIFDSKFVELDPVDEEDGSGSDSDSDADEKDEDDDSNGDEEEDHSGHHHDENGNCVLEDNEEDNQMDIKHIRGAPLAMLMIRTFFRTLIREWGNMDKYRIDKFYTLVRYMLREVYRYMATRQWNLGIVRMFNDAITEEALIVPPNGVRYHLIDIALEELSNVVAVTDTLPMTEAIFLEVLEPFFVMAQHGFGDKHVQARVVEGILEKFLREYSVVSETDTKSDSDEENEEEDKSVKSKIFKQVQVGTVSRFLFQLGTDANTLDMHRKSLYDTHKSYERQMKKTGTDIEIDDEQGGEEQDDDEEDDADYNESMDVEDDAEDDLEAMMGFMNDGESDDSDDAEEEEKPQPLKQTKSKKDKKKQKEQKSKDDSMDLTHHGEAEAGDSSKKSKKKKKKHDKSKKAGSEPTEDNDEVVTISISEQKKAKKAQKEAKVVEEVMETPPKKESKKDKKKKRKSAGDKAEEITADSRRVSFGEKNRARSWKMSMQGLRTMDPKDAVSKTPEKSILHKKNKKSPMTTGKLGKKQRARAIDYF